MNFPTIDRSFFAGECFDAYRVLGAHPCRDDFGQEAGGLPCGPRVPWLWRSAVALTAGGRAFPCRRLTPACGAALCPTLRGRAVQYRIHGKDGSTVMRADPYAFSTELRPGTASRLARMDFAFDDSS